MIRKSLIVKLFDGFTMQRWNDQLRPTELVEADKQAHSISLAYFLARSIEDEEDINMQDLIEQYVFRYLGSLLQISSQQYFQKLNPMILNIEL